MRGAESVNVSASGRCDGCMVSTVNGVRCHEHGCPDAWRDEVRSCLWCGREFTPDAREQWYCDEECSQSFYL